MDFINNTYKRFKQLNVFDKIIAINIIVFIIAFILRKIFKLNKIFSWFVLPDDFFSFLLKPWSIITYGFLHYDLLHILFNMLVLYYASQMALNLFRYKLPLNIYFLGILCGGGFFLLAYNLLPQEFIKPKLDLVGASAGVRALLIFLCAYFPNKEIKVLAFRIKLWHIGITLVVFDFLGLFSGDNQGGSIAHLGGAFLGYIYAKQMQKGIDIGKGFERLMDSIVSLFSSKTPLKTVHKSSKKSYSSFDSKEFKDFNKQKQIDIILDKISKSGYESLTQKEKEFLFKAGK